MHKTKLQKNKWQDEENKKQKLDIIGMNERMHECISA